MTKLFAATALAALAVSGYAGPSAAQNIPPNCLRADIRKPCIVPESAVRELTAEQRSAAIEYARQNGIRWRIARGR